MLSSPYRIYIRRSHCVTLISLWYRQTALYFCYIVYFWENLLVLWLSYSWISVFVCCIVCAQQNLLPEGTFCDFYIMEHWCFVVMLSAHNRISLLTAHDVTLVSPDYLVPVKSASGRVYSVSWMSQNWGICLLCSLHPAEFCSWSYTVQFHIIEQWYFVVGGYVVRQTWQVFASNTFVVVGCFQVIFSVLACVTFSILLWWISLSTPPHFKVLLWSFLATQDRVHLAICGSHCWLSVSCIFTCKRPELWVVICDRCVVIQCTTQILLVRSVRFCDFDITSILVDFPLFVLHSFIWLSFVRFWYLFAV